MPVLSDTSCPTLVVFLYTNSCILVFLSFLSHDISVRGSTTTSVSVHVISFVLFLILHLAYYKTKYMIMSRDQNAGRSYRMKIYNNTIERVGEFKYLGTTLTNKNSIQEEIKSRLKLGNACYYSVQNRFSSSLLSKKLQIKIYRTIILPVVLYGCETWSLTLRYERRLRVFENRVLRRELGLRGTR